MYISLLISTTAQQENIDTLMSEFNDIEALDDEECDTVTEDMADFLHSIVD